VPVVQIAPDGRTLATIEPTLVLQPPPPGVIDPPLLSQNPFLFTHGVSSRVKTTVARSTVSVGWLGGRLMRSDTADDPPYTQRICLLRSNSGFECERLVADDPGREVWDPAASPNGRYVAAVSAPEDEVSGPIVLYSAATGRRVRTLSRKNAATPSWSPDGRWVAFASGRAIYVVRAFGGRARRVVKGVQPVWVPR
jgi:dipeptidyl aminopeptidase/acylaminoacyl peptidase